MKNSIQNSIIRFSGLAFLFREIIQRKKLSIIFLHNWSVQTADKAFKFLSQNYNLISLNDYIEVYHGNDSINLPSKSMIITIDDGYKENYELLPLIKKYNIPITIFLTTGIINTNRHFWFDYKHLLSKSKNLKKISNSMRLDLLKEIGFEKKKEYENSVALNFKQIVEMKKYVDFQSHTIFHPILPTCTDEEAENEIRGSKDFLENEYNLSINSIAFPNGDFSSRDIEMVRNTGYKCSLTTEPGFNTQKSNIFQLKRISVTDHPSYNDIIALASGIRIFAFNIKTIFNKKRRKSNLMKPISTK